jgi:hypothetical protein
MKFWDSSAIIPLCVDEVPTTRIKRLADEDSALVVWWTTPIECYAALARRRREGMLTATDEGQAQRVLSLLCDRWTEIEPSREIREVAMRVLRLHSLRAADSLQLAAALIWAHGHASGLVFVSLDQRLREAASLEGFSVLPEI